MSPRCSGLAAQEEKQTRQEELQVLGTAVKVNYIFENTRETQKIGCGIGRTLCSRCASGLKKYFFETTALSLFLNFS